MTVVLIIAILFLAFMAYWIVKSLKAGGNAKFTHDDHHFEQAGVRVEFGSGRIRIKEHEYAVDQVTGIQAQPYARSGDSRAWKAIIEVDDFECPRHEMNFLSRTKANEFTQRLSTALRKAGGPSFN